MAGKIICIDTSVLIDYYRSKHKADSFFKELFIGYAQMAVSVITKFEIYNGTKDSSESKFWNSLFEDFKIIPIDEHIIEKAIFINRKLRKSSLQMDFPDLLIGATAIEHKLKLATLNAKHFSRIENMKLITSITFK